MSQLSFHEAKNSVSDSVVHLLNEQRKIAECFTVDSCIPFKLNILDRQLPDNKRQFLHQEPVQRASCSSDTEKRSEDDINQSCAAAAFTTSNVDSVAAATPESLPASGGQNHGNPFPKQLRMKLRNLKEDIIKLKQKIIWTLTVEDEANQSSATAITTSRDIVNEIGKLPANVSESLPISRGENLDDSFAEATQKDIVNEIIGVHAAIVDATPESLPVENLGIPSSTEASQKAIPSAADNIQTSNVEADADEAKSVKFTKKTKSLEEEDTLVVSSDSHNVEPVKAVEGEVPDNIIRTVSGSLQEKNASLEVADSQELSVEENNDALEVADSKEFPVEVSNAALEETPLMNNPQDTERDASLFRKCSDDAADKSISNKSLKEKADDMGDNFGCTQNQEKPDQVAGGAKSKKQKKGLDLHPSSSSNGSMKPKEKKSRAQQPASSSTDHLQSRVPNDGSDVTFMYRKLRFSGSVQDTLRRSNSYKKALIRAQSQPDIDDDSPLDCIPSYILSLSGLVLTKNPVMMIKSHVLY
ncbi:unnamed protein product [Brassica rapa subsp. narinosa]